MSGEKRVSLAIPASYHAAAVALTKCCSIPLYEPRPDLGEDVSSAIHINSVGEVLTWFCRRGLDHALSHLELTLSEKRRDLLTERQIVDFFHDNISARLARRQDFPPGTPAIEFFDDPTAERDDEVEYLDEITREEIMSRFEWTHRSVVALTGARDALQAIFDAEEAKRKEWLASEARRAAQAEEERDRERAEAARKVIGGRICSTPALLDEWRARKEAEARQALGATSKQEANASS